MGIFDLFKKAEKQKETSSTLQIGDWVTQYSTGYWKIINIVPKFADEDYNYNGKSWKKGNRLGDWVILKKGFTPKMKPSNACEFVDSQWCSPVSPDILQSIESAFAEDPKVKQRFDAAPDMPKPSIGSNWMLLSDSQAESLSELFMELPERFTSKQFWALAADYRKCIVGPAQATHILYLFSYLWEIDEDFEPLHFGPELKKK